MKFLEKYEYYENYNIKKYNTYKLEVITKYIVFVKDKKELVELLKYLKDNNIKHLILGNGSNVIFSCEYYDGVIIKLDKLNKVNIDGTIVTAEAGVSLISLANTCMKEGLNGLAFAGGIPGLVGASTAMNAGAYKEDMASIVREVKVITPELKIITMSNKELNYAYRNSFLKENKDYICLETKFELTYDSPEKIKEVMDNRRTRRIESQPLDMPTAGSVFRNPEGLAAGKLIEDIGLKGHTIGGAMISTKHANFIVNTGTATYEDIIELIEYTKKKVEEHYNIKLLLEQEIIG